MPIELRYFLLLSCCFGLLTAVASSQTKQTFALDDGDRIVFYGDNVSEVQFYDSVQEPQLYTTFIETYTQTRFPSRHFTFINSAWGGERVNGGWGGPIDLRLRRDVIDHQATVLAIMLGMNDGEGRAYDPTLFKQYVIGYEHIVDSIKHILPKLRITLIQPSPYDDVTHPPDFPGGYNNVLLRFGAFVEGLGRRKSLTVADLNSPLAAALQKAQEKNAALGPSIIPDRTHPGAAGQLIMAEALLKAWHAPAIVSSVSLDSSRKRVTLSENASVTDTRFEQAISWTELDQALPFPINQDDPSVALVLECSDFMQALDQQKLQVTGLSQSNYRLEIDGETIGTFARSELEKGINLALFETPMKRQALHVYHLTQKRNDVYFGRWRQLQLTQGVLYKEGPGKILLNTPAKYVTLLPENDGTIALKEASLKALDTLEQELIALQRSAAQPKPHYYRLVPQ
jgi:lysophospholipase L1-like esterase